jgi:hypothetical protein
MTAIPSPDVAARIAALPRMPIGELRTLYVATFGRPSPVANRRFLERRLAYHWQAVEYEAAHPGVLARQRDRIAALAAAVAAASHAPVRPPVHGLVPGTVLIRAFNGVEHEVKVSPGPTFEYAGQRYPSLSAVARVITGTRWSGPKFFGLPTQGGNA